MRTVEYYDDDVNEWFDIEWPDIVSGTQIRINEEDGSPVLDGTGVHEAITASDSFIYTASGIDDVWAVQCYDPDPYTAPRYEE